MSHPSLCEFEELGLHHGIVLKTTLSVSHCGSYERQMALPRICLMVVA
jgi:hypothetical protein